MNSIKKVASAVAGAVALIAASSAHAENYANAQLAISDVGGGFDNGISVVGTFGIPMEDLLPNSAFEAEVSKALVKPEYNWFGTKMETDYYTLGGYGVYSLPVNDQLNIRARLGLVYSHVTVDIPPFGSGTDTSIGLSAGAGITYKLQPNMNLIAEFTTTNSNGLSSINHLSAGLQFKF